MNPPSSLVAKRVHYYEDNLHREGRVTRFLSVHFCQDLLGVLGIEPPAFVVSELSKHRYGRDGDVDLAVIRFQPDTPIQPENIVETAAIEVKVSHYDSRGKYHSLKPGKHKKQMRVLLKESWNRVYLMDVVVSEPVEGWFHPQTFDILNSFAKEVGVNDCGHIRMIKHGVLGRPEETAGSGIPEVLTEATLRTGSDGLYDIKLGVSTFLFELGFRLADGLFVLNDQTETEAGIRAFQLVPGAIIPLQLGTKPKS